MEGANDDVQEMLLIDPTRSVPNLERRSSIPQMASDDQRFWKEAIPTDPKLNGDIFADGKSADRSLKSRKPGRVKDAADALVEATDYRPEVMSGSIPRLRARNNRRQGMPIVAGIVCVGLVVGGYLLVVQHRNGQDSNPSEAANEPQLGPQQPSTISTTRPAIDQGSGLSSASVSPTNDREVQVAADSSTMTAGPSIERTRKLEGHTAVVLGLAFSPDGKWLSSASGDSTARLWSVDDNTQITLGTSSSKPPRAFISVAFSPDGKLLAASNMDGRIFLWDANPTPPKLLRTLNKHDDPVVAIAFSQDGRFLATGGRNNGLVCIWDLTNPTFPLATSITPEKNGVWSLAYSPDGKTLFEGVSFPSSGKQTHGQVWVWDVSTRPFVKRSVIDNVRKLPRCIVYSPDGSRIAYIDGDVARVADARTGKQITVFEKHSGSGWPCLHAWRQVFAPPQQNLWVRFGSGR